MNGSLPMAGLGVVVDVHRVYAYDGCAHVRECQSGFRCEVRMISSAIAFGPPVLVPAGLKQGGASLHVKVGEDIRLDHRGAGYYYDPLNICDGFKG